MIDSVSVLLILASAVIILGVLGEEFFKRTGVADTLFLLILGFLLGQVFGVVKHSQVMPIIPYFSAIALIFILFDGGLNIDLVQAVKGKLGAGPLSLARFRKLGEHISYPSQEKATSSVVFNYILDIASRRPASRYVRSWERMTLP